ncbi:MAG: hypothetical protein ABI836_06185 [Gemmatimonadota bacterium]
MKRPRSSLNRPLDPRYPTNRAVLIILPLAGLGAAGAALVRGGQGWHLLLAGLGGLGTAFVSWALAREVAPDDNPAAFVSMALAYAAFLWIPHTSIMLVFLTITLARILNRTVGIPATPMDSVAIVLLVAWTMYSNRNPLPAVVAAVAFALDATLEPGLRRQWIFAIVCLVLASLGALPIGVAWNPVVPVESRWVLWVLAVIAAGFVVVIAGTRQLTSTGDLTGAPLSPARVRAGMIVALMIATAGWIPLANGLVQGAQVWAVLLGIIFGRVWPAPARTARRHHHN